MNSLNALLIGALSIALLGSQSVTAADEASHDREITPLEIVLLEPGATPRHALRYELTAGDTQTVIIESASTVSGMGQTMTLPETAMTVSVTVKDVSETRIVASVTIDNALVTNDEGVMPMFVSQFKAAMGNVIGKTATLEMSDRGIDQEFAFSAADKSDDMTRQMLESIENTLSVLITPLPEEEIGAGATWTATSSIKRSGLVVDQVATYAMRAIEGTAMKLEIKVEHSAEDQTIKQRGMEVKFVSLESEGKGVGRISLAELAPVESRMSMEMESKLVYGQGALSQNVTQRVESKTSVTRDE